MATENRSINISYKADLKDLIAKLKQMPNVTEAEAKKMVGALDRQLKQAEKAAKKSAEASKKAAKEAASTAARGAHQFDNLAASARAAEERMEEAADQAGDVDRGFSMIGIALRDVNPQLAEAADGLADTFAVAEGLGKSFLALNPLLIAGAVALGALTLGFVSHQQALEEARQLTLELKDAQKLLNASLEEQQLNLEDAGSKLRQQRLEYKLLTGQITQYEFELSKAGETASESFRTNLESVQENIDDSNLLLKTIRSLTDAYFEAGSSSVVLSESEIERLRTFQLQTDTVKNNIDLTKEGASETAQLMKLEKALLQQITDQTTQRAAIEAMQSEATDKAMEMVNLERELADGTKEAANQSKRRAEQDERALKAKERYKKMMEEALLLGEDQIKELNLQRTLDNQITDSFLDDEGKKRRAQRQRMEDQIARIEDLGLATGREADAELAAIRVREQFEEDAHQSRLDRIQKENEERAKGAKETINDLLSTGEAFSNLMDVRIRGNTIDVEGQRKKQEEISALSDIEQAAYQQKQKQLRSLFRFEKGMALAEIAMSTAEAVIAAQKLPIPFNAISAALAVATGVAQAGVVQSQQMPSFHMGGLAPDEATARVLAGEAILDRSTVRRLGGEQGVKNLQENGGARSQVVVIQPFKHFGRFAKDLGLSSPKMVGIRGY